LQILNYSAPQFPRHPPGIHVDCGFFALEGSPS
jgi:hypothetical protein